MRYYIHNNNKKIKVAKRKRLVKKTSTGISVMFAEYARKIFKTAAISLGVFSLIFSGYYIYQQTDVSSFFRISKFNLKGNHILKESSVKQIVEPVMGRNIFKLDTSLIEDKLNVNEWVETASVKKKYPDGLELNIKERVPFAKIKSLKGKNLLIDRNGFVIKEIENNEYRILPTVYLNNNANYQIGNTLAKDKIKKGIEFIEKIHAFNQSDNSINFTSIKIEAAGRYTLKTPSIDIRLPALNLKESLNNFYIASEIIKKRDLKVKLIDLTFDGQVVLKL